MFDDSMFADKIKPYRPSFDLKAVPEDLQVEDGEQFDLTQIDDGREEEENKMAIIGEA